MLNFDVCQKARLARDPRFDGRFFIAVKTTGIYCRTICPAVAPKEHNVEYYEQATQAAKAGFRPCLRCKPDSAPHSPAWQGTATSIHRALQLIDQGALQNSSLPELAERLGVSDRYLRKLFNQHLGMSPKAYALYQQCLFAKKLLHQTQLPISQVALASGFDSIRRFNDCFKKELKLTPTQMRKKQSKTNPQIELKLSYRPPYNWDKMRAFLQARLVDRLEWCDEHSYGRTIEWDGVKGRFTAHHQAQNCCFLVDIELENVSVLKAVVSNIRRILDVDADLAQIEQDLHTAVGNTFELTQGLRLPGIWHIFEAGIRAILGQQISVVAAKNLVITLVNELGVDTPQGAYFPTPQAIAQSDLAFFKMPGARKQTLKRFAEHFLNDANAHEPNSWLALKGIGPWTVNYAKLRGLSDPDIFLATDLGVVKALKKQGEFVPEQASPWQSYLTFQLWNQL